MEVVQEGVDGRKRMGNQKKKTQVVKEGIGRKEETEEKEGGGKEE